jgi:phage tail sheath protein FI
MAETLVSPGVLAREQDQSFIQGQPVSVGAAIIGPTVKGPVEIPTVVTSYSDFQNRFGSTFVSGGDVYSYLTSISAYNYFQNGGRSLLVARVVSNSGDWDYAQSTNIYNTNGEGVLLTTANALSESISTSPIFTGQTNSGSKSGLSYTTDGSGTGGTIDIEFSYVSHSLTTVANVITTQASTINSFNITGSTFTGSLLTFSGSGDQPGQDFTASLILSSSWQDLNSFQITGQTGEFFDGNVLTLTSQSLGADQGGGTDLEITLSSSIAYNAIISTPFISGVTVSAGTSGFAINDTITISSASLGAAEGYNAVAPSVTASDLVFTVVGDDLEDQAVAFTLETLDKGIIMNSSSSLDPSGSLASGSSNNVRWEVVNRNESSGTFNLLIRRGDDTSKVKNVLETWTNLSLDPKASNYISKVIGDQKYTYNSSENYIQISGDYPNASRYVRVKSVRTTTPDYFDNTGTPKSQFTGSIPVNASGSFYGATGTDINAGAKYYNEITTNTQGLLVGSYTNMISLLANQDDYKYNVISTPGLIDGTHTSAVTSLISNIQSRGDSIYVIDSAVYGSTITTVAGQASSRDTSYAATYWPWVQVQDPDSGKNVWVPASTLIPGVYAFNDNASAPWFAPAGVNRGGLGQVIRAERKLSQSNRDTLYDDKVNPIASFPGTGVVVYGQKTLQTKASALDRVNVRRLLINLKSYISQVSQNLVFEQNSRATRAQFLNAVNPYLESVQSRQGLYAFRVIMDDSNNTPDVIDRNQLIGQIFVQPTKTAEYIYLDFIVQPTGATFPA